MKKINREINRVVIVYKPFPADLVTFTEEILNGKLHFSYSVNFLGIYLIVLGVTFRHV